MRERSEYTFWEHFFILRRYVVISLLAVAGGASLVHYYHATIIEFLFRPLGGVQAVFLSPLDPFLFIFKIDLFGGLILALPVIILCGFLFLAPAMNLRSIAMFSVMFLLSLLSVAGAIAYTIFILVPLSLGFLLSIQIPGIENAFTAQNYLDFLLVQLYMSIGISFIPLVIIFATLMHMLNPYRIGGRRGILYIGITAVLAFLTPTTDLYTLLILLIPALAIFEISILAAKIIHSLRANKQI